MPELVDQRSIPAGGWKYFQRETRTWFEDMTRGALAAKVRAHREYHKIPVPDDLEAEIEDQMCMAQPEGRCRCRPGEPESTWVGDKTRLFSLKLAFSFNRAVMAWLTGGQKLVSDREAKRRAEICKGCPFNKPAGMCACAPFYRTLDRVFPKDKRIEGLNVCAACGCSLTAKVYMPKSVIKASVAKGQQFPDWCWQKELIDG